MLRELDTIERECLALLRGQLEGVREELTSIQKARNRASAYSAAAAASDTHRYLNRSL